MTTKKTSTKKAESVKAKEEADTRTATETKGLLSAIDIENLAEGAVRESKPCIYVGPTLPDGSLTTFTTYINGVAPHVRKSYDEHLFFKQLFVPIGSLQSAQQALSDVNSSLSVFSRKTLEHFSRKG